MKGVIAAGLIVGAIGAGGIDLDVTLEDVDRALAIARSREEQRARFHAPYVRNIDTPFVERAEIISEFRRVVLIAEDRQRRGDRLFAYSITQAAAAVEPWKRRVALAARIRFHPQNVYVTLPPIDVRVLGAPDARIGVSAEPVLSLPPGRSGAFVPILGANVEGVFDAVRLGQASHTFVISIEGRDVAAVTFDLASLE
jgi:hypothetical protein